MSFLKGIEDRERVADRLREKAHHMRVTRNAPVNVPELWPHQQETLELARKQSYMLDLSDPGTGKTASTLTAFAERRRDGGGCALVIAPKSLLKPAWYDDATVFTPDLTCSIAYAQNRAKAFAQVADIYITNTDAVKWLAGQNRDFLRRFDTVIIDELAAYKHRDSQRSKAIAKMMTNFDYRVGLNGTFTAGTVLDAWHQAKLIDDGRRLGKNFYQYRNAVSYQKPNFPGSQFSKWVDRPGAPEVVADLLQDITIRHRFDDVMDIPPNYTRTVHYYPSNALMKKYKEMERDTVLILKDGDVTAVNAAALRTKLLQIASGAVYGEGGEYHVIDTERYELIIDLATEVKHSIVFFNWTHQKEQLIKIAEKKKFLYAVIDGTVNVKKRNEIVQAYQDGQYHFLLMHPNTGAHGLTLTRGTRTVWSSPIYQPDFLKQGMHRIWRGGQTEKTETILVEALGTVEHNVYGMLNDKYTNMVGLLEMLE